MYTDIDEWVNWFKMNVMPQNEYHVRNISFSITQCYTHFLKVAAMLDLSCCCMAAWPRVRLEVTFTSCIPFWYLTIPISLWLSFICHYFFVSPQNPIIYSGCILQYLLILVVPKFMQHCTTQCRPRGWHEW